MSGITYAQAKGINATASVADVAAFSTLSDTFVDATGYTVNITTTKTCTILAWAFTQGSNDSAGFGGAVRLVIDGIAQEPQATFTQGTAGSENALSVCGRKTGVAAGTITVKLQTRRTGGASTFTLEKSTGIFTNFILVVAVEE